MGINYKKLTDIELIDLVVNKNELTAFDELVIRYKLNLQRVIALVIKDNDSVEDVLQETFIRAFKALKNFQAKASLKTWFTRIAVNLSINYIQRVKKKKANIASIDEKTSEDQASANFFEHKYLKSENDMPEDLLLQNELTQTIKGIVESELDPVSQLIIDLRFFQNYSIKEISDIVAKPQGTVRSKLFYAKKLLKKHIEKNHPDLVDLI